LLKGGAGRGDGKEHLPTSVKNKKTGGNRGYARSRFWGGIDWGKEKG